MGERKRILVIDDESSIRKLMEMELEDEGYDVTVAEDGVDALEKVSQAKYDLITLDIRMPNMDGIQFLGEVRDKDKEVPIIICTAYGTHKQDLVVWGANDYVIKSGDLTELKAKVKAHLHQREGG
jgi:DNA-binding response OmpR family regulator